MTARLLLLLSSLLLAAPAAAQRRAVMENLATTGTSIFISSTATRVGIGTASPASTLDVNVSGADVTISLNGQPTLTRTSATGSTTVGSNAGAVIAAPAGAESGRFDVSGLTMVANADIVLSGASGVLTSGSSITASAFFGNGSALTGISAAETNTYTSSKTFTTNVLMKASATASGFFGDGSALTNISAVSTVTYNLTGATTETTNFKVCYATGTLTLLAGTQVQVTYSGDITNSGAAGQYCVINFLQDGAFISPASSTIGMGKSNNASAGGSGNATTVRVFPSPGAGSHSWCVSMISPFGATCTFTSSAVLGNQFSVTELR